jgi:hypothetical protein
MAIDFNSKKLMKIKCNRFRYFIFIKGKKNYECEQKKRIISKFKTYNSRKNELKKNLEYRALHIICFNLC